MQEKNILKIAVTGIIFYMIASGIVSVLNSLFVFVNSKLHLESEILIGVVHLFLGVVAAVIVIVLYICFLKDKTPSSVTVILSFVLLLIISIGALFLSTLSVTVSAAGGSSSMATMAIHQQSRLLSTQIVMPLTLFIYFLVRIYRK